MASSITKKYDQTNYNWSTLEYNIVFLMTMQKYLNDKLNIAGHLFLNEVYDSLGLDRSATGARLGWCAKTGTPVVLHWDLNGDGTIDIDFNPTGEIVSHLPEF